jgi:hypothetical protein
MNADLTTSSGCASTAPAPDADALFEQIEYAVCAKAAGRDSGQLLAAKNALRALAQKAAVSAQLLAVLQEIYAFEEGPGETDRPMMARARAAIAKATEAA